MFRDGDDYVEFDAAKDADDDDDVFAGDDDDDDDEDASLLDDDDDDDEDDDEDDDDDGGLDDDELDEAEAPEDPMAEVLRWGASKKRYWGGDTGDLEIGQDAADAVEEEELAAEIARRQMEALDDDDFALEGAATVAADGGGAATGGLGAAAHAGGLFGALARALGPAGGEAAAVGGGAAAAAAPETAALLAKLRDAAGALAAAPAPGPPGDATPRGKSRRVLLHVRDQLLRSLAANVGFYLLLRAEGDADPRRHPVLCRVVSLKRKLDALAPLEGDLLREPRPKRAAVDAADDDADAEDEEAEAAEASEEEEADDDDDDDAAFEAVPTVDGAAAEKGRRSGAKAAAKFAAALRRKGLEGETGGAKTYGDVDVDFSSAKIDKPARRHFLDDEPDDDDDASGGGGGGPEDDGAADDGGGFGLDDGEAAFLRAYEDAAATQGAKRAKKKAKFEVAPRYGDWRGTVAEPAVLSSDRRAASKAIVENKGLAPHKPRKNRNPRVKKKVKYAKALVRRKGQVRDSLAADTDKFNYAGEATGIRGAISRSRRMAQAS